MPATESPERHLTDGQRLGLRQLDVDWPDSRAFFSRLAQGLYSHADSEDAWKQRLRALAKAGLTAHRGALQARLPEVQRFAAFVAALEEHLTGTEHRHLAQALTPQQRRALNRPLRLVGGREVRDDAG